ALASLADELGRRRIALTLARPTGPLRDLLRGFGLGDLAGSAEDARRGLSAVVATSGDETPGRPDATPMDEVAADAAPAPPAAGSTARGPVEPPPRRWSLGLPILVVIAVVALVLAVVLGDGRVRPSADHVVVPNLIGLPLDRARAATDQAGLVLDEPTIVQSSSLAEGTVVAQAPDPGVAVEPGSPIQPTVSTGRGLVVVPDVSGRTEAQAIVDLTTAGLRVGASTRVADAAVRAGIVIGSEPAADRTVAADTTVALMVSSGPAEAPPAVSPEVTRPPATPAPVPSATMTPTAAPPSSTPTAAPASTEPSPITASPSTVPSPSP
ncbi:MAG TPA: PASTA domain-containing protein, partial [Candidatus Saccharimonadales bacterium]|nr:PASTA domain-containing protein [Candidatus Saccharimonadales bacterium]